MILEIVTDTFANVDEILQDLQINDEKFDITSGNVTVTDPVPFNLVKETSQTYTELNATGTLTLNSIRDSFENIIAVDSLAQEFNQQITMSDASVQVIDTVNLNQIIELRDDTTGDITVDIVADSKNNLSIINDFASEPGVVGDVFLSDSDITVTDVVSKEEADIVNSYNDVSGTVTLTSVSDVLANVNTLSSTPGISIATSDLQVTDVTTLSDAQDLDGYTTGEVTLDVVTDSFENVKAIFNLTPSVENTDGVNLTSAEITITDPINLSQANEVNGFTTGLVTLISVKDTHQNLISIDAINNSELTMANATVEVIGNVNLSQVDELRADTSGDITINEITDVKENLAVVNTYKDEGVTILDNTLSIDINSGITNSSLENASSFNTKEINLTLISEDETQYSAKATIQFDGSQDEVEDSFALNKANIIKDLVNSNLEDNSDYRVLTSTYFDSAINGDVSASVDLNDQNIILISSENESNILSSGDINVSNISITNEEELTITQEEQLTKSSSTFQSFNLLNAEKFSLKIQMLI